MTSMTKDQASALSLLVHELRPDWDAPGVFAALKDAAAGSSAEALAIAAIRAACDHRNRTPAVIPLPGPHWRDRTPAAERPLAVTTCELHPTAAIRTDGECAACYADRAGTTEPGPLQRRGVPPTDEQRGRILAALRGGDRP